MKTHTRLAPVSAYHTLKLQTDPCVPKSPTNSLRPLLLAPLRHPFATWPRLLLPFRSLQAVQAELPLVQGHPAQLVPEQLGIHSDICLKKGYELSRATFRILSDWAEDLRSLGLTYTSLSFQRPCLQRVQS